MNHQSWLELNHLQEQQRLVLTEPASFAGFEKAIIGLVYCLATENIENNGLDQICTMHQT